MTPEYMESLLILLAMYYSHHEGEHIGDFSETEIRELTHSWLCNQGLDPYTNGGPGRILDLIQALESARPKTPFTALNNGLVRHLGQVAADDDAQENARIESLEAQYHAEQSAQYEAEAAAADQAQWEDEQAAEAEAAYMASQEGF